MDLARLIVLGILLLCAVIGMFVRPRTVAIVCALLLVGAAAGVGYGYGSGNEAFGFMSGVAAMAICTLGVVAVTGGAMLRSVLNRR